MITLVTLCHSIGTHRRRSAAHGLEHLLLDAAEARHLGGQPPGPNRPSSLGLPSCAATFGPVDANASGPRVLVIGLDPYRVPGPWDPAPVVDAIAVGIARFAEAGVEVETCLFGLDGSDDIEAVVTEALDSRPW